MIIAFVILVWHIVFTLWWFETWERRERNLRIKRRMDDINASMEACKRIPPGTIIESRYLVKIGNTPIKWVGCRFGKSLEH